MSLARVEVIAVTGAVVAGVFVLWRAGKLVASVGSGVLSGDNAITRNATDASGAPVTAYQGAGVVGTVGAATNAVSGGYLASFGSWLGLTAYDLTHVDPIPSVGKPSAPLGQGYNTNGEFDPINAGVFGYGS